MFAPDQLRKLENEYLRLLDTAAAACAAAAKAHDELMAARTARATQDAQDLHPQRPPALLRRKYVCADGVGRGEVLRQADELPYAP